MENKIVDAHVHCDSPDLITKGLNSLSNAGIGRVALQSPGYNRVSFPSRQPVFGNSNPVVAAAKSLYPDTVFTFGGINHYPASELSPQEFSRDLVEQLTNLGKSGFDGIKLLGTKTAFYIDYPYKLFDDVFVDFFSELSRLQMPVMWHVGDPAVFWDPDNVPSHAKEQGWFYGTDGYPTLEELHDSTIEILDNNPGLKVIFAHFFFMSDRLEKLGDLLDRYPSIYVDVTPGVEIYRDFSLNRADARNFFIKYQNRILFGTDLAIRGDYDDYDEEYPGEQIGWMRRFFETDQDIDLGENVDERLRYLKGLDLPDDVIEKIYWKNFDSVVGPHPRSLDKEEILAECDRISQIQPESPPEQPNVPEKARQILLENL